MDFPGFSERVVYDRRWREVQRALKQCREWFAFICSHQAVGGEGASSRSGGIQKYRPMEVERGQLMLFVSEAVCPNMQVSE